MKSNIPYKFIAAASVVLSLTFCSMQQKHQEVQVLTPKEQQHIISETQCIAEALWFEAAGEGLVGQVAVLSVIHNRTLHRNYPDTYCGVIQQSRQFSYRNHLSAGQTRIKTPVNALERSVATQVQTLAFQAATGAFKPVLPQSVLHYHVASMKVAPKWAIQNKFCTNCKMKPKNPQFYVKIGSHHFLRS